MVPSFLKESVKRYKHEIPSPKITPRSAWMDRRAFMSTALLAGASVAAAKSMTAILKPSADAPANQTLATVPSSLSTQGVKWTTLEDITHYNNFYEFGPDKDDPSKNAWRLTTRPWTVSVEGLVQKPRTFDIDALLKLRPLEQRVYRFRCVEAWSMVVPWVGYSLRSHRYRAATACR